MSSIALSLARPWSGLTRFGRSVSRLVPTVELALQVRRERRLLSSMDDRALADLGFDRSQARNEARRGFWDVPLDRLHA